MDSDSDRPSVSSPFADTSVSVKWGVTRRLWLGFAVLVGLLLLTGLVSHQYILRIGKDLSQIVAVEEPLEEAVLEMQINAGETARAVLYFLGDANSDHLEMLRDSEADFERFAAEYHELAETSEERALGFKVAQQYGVFKLLGDEIVSLAQRRNASLKGFRQNILEIDALIDHKLQAAIDRDAPQGTAKIEASLGMEINIFEAFTAILGYISRPDPTLREEIRDAESDFERYLASYRRYGLSEAETGWLDAIDGDFRRAVTAGNRILAITDRLQERLAEFGRVLETIDGLLDDRIQPLIQAETARAAADAETSIDRANVLILVIAGIGVVLGIGTAWASSRAIQVPLRSLIRGADIVGAGTLTHRIDVGSGTEFSHLASAFNRMVGNLAQAQGDLADRQGRLQSVLDTAADGIVTIDGEARITSFNRTAETMFGFSATEVMGRNVKMLMPAPYHGEHDGYLAQYRETGEKRIIGIGREVEGRRQDGTTFPMDLAVSEFRRGDEVVYTGILRDITERKRAETMKNEFISTVSHELRTPLTSIQGSLGLLRGGVSGEIPEKARSLIELAHRNCGRLVRLINDLLDIEKIEAGKLRFDLRRHDLVELVGQAVQMNQPFADKFEVGIVVEEAPEKAVAMVDADRFSQVMTNLLSNAAKFSRANTRIEISVARRGGWIEVAVADHGPGIPMDLRDCVFEKFTQADASDDRVAEGTGLGLSITKAIVEKHGGRIGFESELGVGTTFQFSIPDLTGGLSSSPIARPDAARQVDPEAARVLICEDDTDIAVILAQMLSSSGYACDVAGDAEQAKVMLAKRDYDALSLDLLLPGQDGISLIRDLRRDARTRELPIIVVSVKAEEGRTEISNGDAISVIDWLQKPVEPTHLLEAVRSAVDASVLKPRILYVNGGDDAAATITARLGEVLKVVGAATLDEALARIREAPFDLVILDLGTPGSHRRQILDSIQEIAGAALPVMILTDDQTFEGLAAEIAEILTKSPTSFEGLRQRFESLILSGRRRQPTEEAGS